jgi:glycosyltransferase involved in cell wall biosynthesis
MSQLEVLCATMHQKNFAKIQAMNLQSDVVFANQADRFAYDEAKFNGYTARMVTTRQRGVGKNRNVALLYATADICIFADDDLRYVDGFRDKITAAFEEIPAADVLIFNLTSQAPRSQRQHTTVRKCRFWNVFGYGTCRIAFKLNAVRKANIWFSQLFGGGCQYPGGEDSLWLLEALRKGLKIYTYPAVVGVVKQEESTWFTGYNEEYFFGRGAWTQAAWPQWKYVLFLYYLIRLGNLATMPLRQMFRAMCAGAQAYQQSLIYREWAGGERYGGKNDV